MSTDPPGAAPTPLRLLIVEDSLEDAQLIIRAVVRGGYDPTWRLVDTAEQMTEALDEERWDIVLSDWSLPRFSGLMAFELLQVRQPDVPLLLVSGTVGEETVASAINGGVRDFVLKDHLERLGPAIRRALAHEAERRRRKEAERALRDSEARYRDLFESYPQPMWVYDQSTLAFLAVNNAAVAHYGYRSDEFLAMTILDLRPPEDRAAVVTNIASTAAGFQRSGVFRHRKKDGAVIFVDIASHELRFGRASGRLVLATDVTDLLRSREDRSRLAAIVDATEDAIIDKTLDGIVTGWNAAAERLYGYTAQEAVGRHIGFLTPPDREAEVETILASARAGQRVEGLETTRLHQDGREIAMALTVTPLLDAEGRPVGASTIARDLSERNRARRALQQSEQRVRLLLDSTAEAIFGLDLKGRCTFTNAACLRMLGFSDAQELLGRDWHDALHHSKPDGTSIAEADCRIRAAFRTGENVHVNDEVLWRKDGSSFPVEYWSYPIREGGVVIGSVVTFLDITDRKRAAEELARSEHYFRSLTEHSLDVTATISSDGTLVYVSPSAEPVLGYRPEELAGRRLLEIIHPDDAARAETTFLRSLETGQRFEQVELRVRHGNGSWRTLSATGKPLGRETGLRGLILNARDLTERLELEAQLRQSQKMEAMGRLASGVAHDFNNLLTVISGYGELLLETLPPGSVHRDAVEQIALAGDKAAGLTRQLLAFSRKQVQAPQILDLNGVVRDMDKLLRRMIGEDVDLLTSLDPSLSPVLADRGQIEQIVMNLAVNARDAMPEGGQLTLETGNVDLDDAYVRRHLRARAGSYVMLAVSDTGVGMDEATLAHIFEPFFTTKDAGKGTGLGLATVHGIVEQSGGNLWVYSVPGRGTTFKVYLPRTTLEPAGGRPAPTHRSAAAVRASETILLIDDDAAVRRLTREILTAEGYKVLDAPLADDALRIAREYPGVLHLLIADVVMPGSSGPDLAERIQGLRPPIKVLFMSGYSDVAITRHRILSEGASFLTKPFTPAALAKRVREVLRG